MPKNEIPPPPPSGRHQRHPLLWTLRLWMWLFLLTVSAGAGVGMGAFFCYLSMLSPIPAMENYKPQQLTRVYDRSNENLIASYYTQKREFLSQAKMPANLKNAFIAIEDERFYSHFGVDLRGVARALTTNARRGSAKQGASTITQQLARDMVVGKKRTLDRKIREAIVAVFIEQRYSKDQILEFYLNQIFFGHQALGVQTAARTYFGKDARELSVAECASLAAIPKDPNVLNPFANPGKNRERRNLILDKMRELNFIDAEVLESAKDEEVLTTKTQQVRVKNPYFMDLMDHSLAHDKELRDSIMSSGGYQIFSTMHAGWQQIVEEEVAKGLPEVETKWQDAKPGRQAEEERRLQKKSGSTEPKKGQQRLAVIQEVREDGVQVQLEGWRGFAPFRKEMTASDKKREPGEKAELVWTGRYIKPWYHPEEVLKKGRLIDVFIIDTDPAKRALTLQLLDRTHVQAAAVLLDVQTGQVLAVSGGADFNDQANNGNWNRAIREPGRQPGSSFKPLLYATALQHGRTLGTIIVDEEVEFNGFKPRNYEPDYMGPTTLIQALAHSNNVITVKLFNELGFKRALEGYHKFNILGAAHHEKPWTLRHELSLCLGSLSVTPLSIAAAYLPFARHGTIIEPWCIQRITSLENQPIADLPTPKESVVLTPENAYLATRMLREVVLSGTGKRHIGDCFDWTKTPEIAGKTGTTNGCVDAWFVGYTPELVLAVWTGFDTSRPMGPGMTGGKVSAPIWRGIMQRVLATRDDWKMKFDVPSNIVFRDISSQTGLVASEKTISGDERVLYEMPFILGTEPKGQNPGRAASVPKAAGPAKREFDEGESSGGEVQDFEMTGNAAATPTPAAGASADPLVPNL